MAALTRASEHRLGDYDTQPGDTFIHPELGPLVAISAPCNGPFHVCEHCVGHHSVYAEESMPMHDSVPCKTVPACRGVSWIPDTLEARAIIAIQILEQA